MSKTTGKKSCSVFLAVFVSTFWMGCRSETADTGEGLHTERTSPRQPQPIEDDPNDRSTDREVVDTMQEVDVTLSTADQEAETHAWLSYGGEMALWIVSRDRRFRETLAPLASRDLADGSLNYAGFDETKATYLLSTGHQAFTSTLGRHRAFEAVVIHCNKQVGWLEEDFFSIQDNLLAAREAFPEVFGPGSKIPGSPKTVWPLQKVVDVVVPRNRELFISKDELHDAARRDYVSKHGSIPNKVSYWAELPVPNQHMVKWVEKPTYPFPGEPLPLDFKTYGLDRSVYEE